jgi:hypothetical protein
MVPKKINIGLPRGKATSLAIWSPPGPPKVKPPAKVSGKELASLTLKAKAAAMMMTRLLIATRNAIR